MKETGSDRRDTARPTARREDEHVASMVWELVDTVGDQVFSRAQRFMSRDARMQYQRMSMCMANLMGAATANIGN